MSTPDAVPLVVVVSGPSGAGKDTVIRAALALDASLSTVATVKTRAPRPGEIDGVHQVFLTDQEFDQWLADDAFLEHAEVYGHRSGVPRAAVAQLLAEGKTVILRTDVQGARTLKQRLHDPLLVFVAAPDAETLARRMRSRSGDSEEEMKCRLAAAAAEMIESEWFDVEIVNADNREQEAAQALIDAIETERARRRSGDSIKQSVDSDV